VNVVSSLKEFREPFPLRAKLRLGVEIAAVYAAVRWLLWRRGLPKTLAVLRDAKRTRTVAPDERSAQLTGVRLGGTVGRALGRLPFDGRCLVRSLVLSVLLARRGIESTVVIGVTPQPEFAAHAWVECRGYPLLDPGEQAYERLVEL
jgi:hypothetical protein